MQRAYDPPRALFLVSIYKAQVPRACACSRRRDNERSVFSLATMAAVKITTRHDTHRERTPSVKRRFKLVLGRHKFHKLIPGTVGTPSVLDHVGRQESIISF